MSMCNNSDNQNSPTYTKKKGWSARNKEKKKKKRRRKKTEMLGGGDGERENKQSYIIRIGSGYGKNEKVLGCVFRSN